MSATKIEDGKTSRKQEEAGPQAVLRQHAEQQFAEELAELVKLDERQRPPNWKFSPWAVRTYILGGMLPDGFVVSPQIYWQRAAGRDCHRHARHRPRPAALRPARNRKMLGE